jgi:hypothetical protein
MELSAPLNPALTSVADIRSMTLPPLGYDLGRAGDLDAERPSISQLQQAQVRALQAGDARRAAAYALVVRRRIEAAQRAAHTPAA